MKYLTLNQTWVLCLRMWRWIDKEWEKGSKRKTIISGLKKAWLRDNGFEVSDNESKNCFFCLYTDEISCKHCPGVLVDPHFRCDNLDYCWYKKPPAFYQELLRLNRIRKGKK